MRCDSIFMGITFLKRAGVFGALLSIVVFTRPAASLNENGISAWPVPFNPSRQTLTIDYAPGEAKDTPAPDRIRIEIFDINGDLVYEGSYAALPIIWNGRNMSGLMVHPGLYILKLRVEQSELGTLGRRIIRIVVLR